MTRQLQAAKTQLLTIRITAPDKITENDESSYPIDGTVLVRFLDKYQGDTIEIDDRFDVTYTFEELPAPEKAAIENLIRVFEDQSKTRLGLE